jgi:hypothetical protein
MPTLRIEQSEAKVKVAVVFELEKIRPVWFEVLGKERVQVGEICGVWYHSQGSARIINFDVWDGRERCQLVYNTQELSWSVGATVIE